MDGLNADVTTQIVSLLLTAGAVYGAIRSDIKGIHQRITDIKASSDDAHKRLDELLMEDRRKNTR
jgi:hypothetical protein